MKYKLEKPLHGEIGTAKYQCTISWRNGQFISDEPVSAGGKDEGPDPFTLLLSSLASCTLITLRMYIDRKGMDIPQISVNANLYQEIKEEKLVTTIDRDIVFHSEISDEVKNKLVEIAKLCPVSKILEGDTHIRTFVFKDDVNAKTINYKNDEITVDWKPEFCQHSTRCWKDLLQVFDPRVKKWINVDGASAERIKEQVERCPSGALSFRYNEDKPEVPV
ncbi:(4Fe-4S)-binding protein [Sediminibacterium ginsengisoli]|uniref:Putative redox protein n=1 Tax=Sediminibacterium ginsengisoli TaxID=413434 RepID=A0A1T4M6B2_9BACT|nr:(4Fe-4S)-binding protein [Sediminibacterium ginsengisoli]SJZ62441.1 putative redox protein [Sediminibacterium ginsengisoli]